tara:strand:- start:43 stop:765 length:723 start_codon:yes stop_codon:yes gene_type:complete
MSIASSAHAAATSTSTSAGDQSSGSSNETTADGITSSVDISTAVDMLGTETVDTTAVDMLGTEINATVDSAGTAAPESIWSGNPHTGNKTKPGEGEWADGAWTNKPGTQLPSIAGDGTTKVTSTSTTTGSLKPKQKPSPGDRELNQGGRDPSDTDANDSSTNTNDHFDPSAVNPGVSTSEVSDEIGHPDFGPDATDKSDDTAGPDSSSVLGGPGGPAGTPGTGSTSGSSAEMPAGTGIET